MKLLLIMKELLENTDSSHPASVSHLIEMLGANGIPAERKSIYDDIDTLRLFGLDIENRRERPSGYYIASREFELAELKLLVDSVQSSKFITHRKSGQLIKKLEALAGRFDAGQLQRQVYVANRIKTMNESIYYNVDKIHTAISKNAKVRFQYFEWTPDKKIQLKKQGGLYKISPWGLAWQEDNYYLIGFDSQAGIIKHYRVDKMLRLEVMRAKREGKEVFRKFDTASYTRKTFGMFGGEEEKVHLLCRNQMAGVMIDRFGKDVMMYKENEERFRVIVDVNVSSQFFGWIAGLGQEVQIAAPQKVREQFKEYLDKLRDQYK